MRRRWMDMRSLYLAAALALLVAASMMPAASALTIDEARQLFQQKGCTGCHNGNLAPDFDGTVKKMQEWAQKYGSLDEAVKAEAKSFKMYQNAQSWDQLINQMPGITPELRKFFEDVFNEAKGGAGGAAEQPAGGAEQAPAAAVTVTTTITVTKMETVTKTQTVFKHVTVTVTPAGQDQGTAGLIAKAGYVAALIVAVAVVILAYSMFGRK